MSKRKAVKPAKVQKVIKPVYPDDPETVEIAVHDAEPLYRELRIENTLEDEKNNKVKLKEGADVDVVIEAEPDATVPKNSKPKT